MVSHSWQECMDQLRSKKLAGKFLEVFPGGILRGNVLGRFPELWAENVSVLVHPDICS